MRNQVLGHVSHGGVRDERNLFDVLVMVPHEAEVSGQRSERGPTGKARRFHDEAREVALRGNVRIDRLSKLLEVRFLQRRFRTEVQDAACRVEGCSIILRYAGIISPQNRSVARRPPMTAVPMPSFAESVTCKSAVTMNAGVTAKL